MTEKHSVCFHGVSPSRSGHLYLYVQTLTSNRPWRESGHTPHIPRGRTHTHHPSGRIYTLPPTTHDQTHKSTTQTTNSCSLHITKPTTPRPTPHSTYLTHYRPTKAPSLLTQNTLTTSKNPCTSSHTILIGRPPYSSRTFRPRCTH